MWTFVTDVVNVYIYSIILQILVNMVVHVEAFKSGLVSHVSTHKIVVTKTSTLHQPLRYLRAFVAFHLDRGMDSLQLFL